MTDTKQPIDKRILGDQRIFQAVVNDLKMKHELVELADGTHRWVYTYDEIDPYELEDSAFPLTMQLIHQYGDTREAEGREKAKGDGQFVVNLNDDTAPLAEALWWSYQHDTCHNYSSLEESTGKEKAELKKLLEPFKRLGLVKAYRGLMTEDGEVAGSGFGVTGLGSHQAIELALYRHHYNDRPYGRSEDYVPKTLTVGEYTYELKKTKEESNDS